MIIGVAGRAYSGKDSIADHLVANHGFVKLSLAAPLKSICAMVFDLSTEQVNGSLKAEVDPRYGKSPRDILQFIGTEGFRSVDPDCWVQLLLRQAKEAGKPVVVPDVRFMNEARVLREAKAVLWRVECPDHPRQLAMTQAQKAHPSESEHLFIPHEWLSAAFKVPYGQLFRLYECVDLELTRPTGHLPTRFYGDW